MGQRRQFEEGDKAPNNGFYVEIGETGSMVNNPQKIHLEAGKEFPALTNKDRKWTYHRKP
ncbi:YjzC family protein [Alteribacter lacisalsi]|uniref:YjzC family protein n=1 Tax=Alteribacter lacisalsi TaxID=2045244 RepID=A0A2W0HK35_9BACI|nr:YjzC family protein [Alteribacter lacisalsi]PYZ97442.1 YjzC family protein [Alteribacter lacisalsi]